MSHTYFYTTKPFWRNLVNLSFILGQNMISGPTQSKMQVMWPLLVHTLRSKFH